MRKLSLELCIFIFFIFSFSSCVEHEFDFDDDNLDKNAIFSPDGVNIPIGNLERVLVLEELEKQYHGDENIQVGPNGVLFLNYKGEFPIVFPSFTTPVFEGCETVPIQVENIRGNDFIPPGFFSLVSEDQTEYEMETPIIHNEKEELEVTLQTIYFDSYPLDLTFNFEDMRINAAGDGKIIVNLNFPANFILEGGQRNVICEVNVHDRNADGSYTVKDVAEVKSYMYQKENEGLSYSVSLDVTKNLDVKAGLQPKFHLAVSVDNEKVKTSYLSCYVFGKEIVTGVIDGFGDLTDSFENTILEFINPSILTTITTNLNTDFDLDFGLSASGQTAFIADLPHIKPTEAYPAVKATKNFLAPYEEGKPEGVPYERFELNNLFSSFLPEEIDYRLIAKFNSQIALYPLYQQFRAEYELNLPFMFANIDLEIKEVAENVFDEDAYDKLFKNAKEEVSIEADNVVISMDEEINVNISAFILDGDNNVLIRMDDVLIDNNKLKMIISGQDLDKMRYARHLEFIFHLTGKGALVEDDYIDINGLRLISDGGIHIEF